MIRCHITDRNLSGCERSIAGGVDYLQIRDKDLPARDLAILVRRALDLANGAPTRILVNTRADIAIACRAHGVHLPSHSPSPTEFRRIAPPGFVIGVSCHTLDELRQAESEGADFALFGPVFAPRSKPTTTSPTGLAGLHAACQTVKIPILALGGITHENTTACLDAGAAGIAAITLFL